MLTIDASVWLNADSLTEPHGCDLVSLDHEHLTRLPPVLKTLNPADALAQLVRSVKLE
jgi:hypothetical protein